MTRDEILEEDFDEQVSVAIITKKLQRSIVRAIAINEIKCTRKDHSENKLFRELGEDAFFYALVKI